MPLGCGRQPFLAPSLPEPGRAQLFFQREAKCCLRQGFLALKCRTHLLLFKADQWEVDLTLMAQRCCWSMLSRGFLGLKELEGGGGDAERNILNSSLGWKIAEASCDCASMDLCQQMMSLLFNMLFSWVIAFLPRSKCLLISWLQSPSAVILEHTQK